MFLQRSQDGPVHIIRWDDDENRVNVDSLAEWHATLDELEQLEGAAAAVFCGTGKYFSNGLDLDRLGGSSDEWPTTISELNRLFGRLMMLPMYTVSAVNGHAFAAGAMMSLCTDERVMRSDRGYWSLPEADLALPLTEEMFAVVTARLPDVTARRAVLTAMRFGGPEALEAGIVDGIAAADDLVENAVRRAGSMAETSRATLHAHKVLFDGDLARRLGWCTAELTPL